MPEVGLSSELSKSHAGGVSNVNANCPAMRFQKYHFLGVSFSNARIGAGRARPTEAGRAGRAEIPKPSKSFVILIPGAKKPG